MSTINRERLIRDLRELATFGKVGTGVNRLSFSPEDIAARRWLVAKMTAAGLDARIDGIGNVYGRAKGAARTVLMGSHTDTVPNGGWLDGALGVIYGLEISRSLIERNRYADRGVDVISFIDEEGTYTSFLGSRSFCGTVSAEQIGAARSLAGKPLTDALKESALPGGAPATLDKGRHFAYLEAHIEQGPRLEAEAKRIGVVTGIVGIRNHRLSFEGRADHAGTTPMAMRRDAGAALVGFAHRLLQKFAEAAGPHTVWNLGNASFVPGRMNVVPSRTELALQYRDPTPAILSRFDSIVRECAAAANRSGPVKVADATIFSTEPADMDPRIGEAIIAAADRHRAPWMRMPSGAGHDAITISRQMPAGMLFIPSIGGRSHTIEEDTSEADIVIGAEVALSAVETLLERAGI